MLRTLRGTKILIFIVKTLSRGAGSVIMCCRCICSCHCISVSVSDFATFVPTKTAHVAKGDKAGVWCVGGGVAAAATAAAAVAVAKLLRKCFHANSIRNATTQSLPRNKG